MKKLLLIFALFLCTDLLSAQTLAWAKTFGGSTLDNAVFTTTDAVGNVYTSGYCTGTADLDPGTGTSNYTTVGSWDFYVQKLSSSGTFIWGKGFGGFNYESAQSIAVDASGNVYICGFFQGNLDFDPGSGSHAISSTGADDAYLLKLDASGNFLWVRTFGSSIGYEDGVSIALDNSGNIYFTGFYWTTVDFDPDTATTLNFTSAGQADIFITKFDPSGDLLWAESIGGVGNDTPSRLTVSNAGNLYLIGLYENTADLNPGTGTNNFTSVGSEDVFVLKLDNAGNYSWANSLGGVGGENGTGIDVDPMENIYIAGAFWYTTDFDPGAGTLNITSMGADDVFVQKLNSSGAHVWTKICGGTGAELAYGLSVDPQGNVFVTGEADAPGDYDPGSGTATLTPFGGADAFMLMLDNSGNYVWSYILGGTTATDFGYTAHADNFGSVYFCGSFLGMADFDPGSGTATQNASGTFGNAFIQKLNVTVGVSENQNDISFDCFPNPSNGSFIIASEESILAIEITNILGQTIYSSFPNSEEIEIDINTQPTEIYFVKAKTESGVGMKKIIKN